MTIEESLFAFVTATPGIAAQIGTRFYPDVLPEPATLPAATYTGISLVDWRSFDSGGLQQQHLQIEAWGDTRVSASAAAAALYELLDDYSGPLPGGFVADITRDNQRSGFDQNRRKYYVQTDWLLQLTAA